MHALGPDYAPATTSISGYAVGRRGWVMTTAWLVVSSGCLMLVLGLARSGPRSGAARVGILPSLLVFAFVLQFLTAYFAVLYGLANRFFATVLIVWLLAIPFLVRAVARE